jgi:hypothetical protein
MGLTDGSAKRDYDYTDQQSETSRKLPVFAFDFDEFNDLMCQYRGVHGERGDQE